MAQQRKEESVVSFMLFAQHFMHRSPVVEFRRSLLVIPITSVQRCFLPFRHRDLRTARRYCIQNVFNQQQFFRQFRSVDLFFDFFWSHVGLAGMLGGGRCCVPTQTKGADDLQDGCKLRVTLGGQRLV